MIQSVSGIGALQADPEGGPPALVNTLICELTAMTAAQVVVSALYAREQTGVGQRVDVSMLDASLFLLWPDAMLNSTFVGDDVPMRPYGSHARFVRRTKDGHVCTMPVKRQEWLALFEALGLPNLFEDERLRGADGFDARRFEEVLDEAYQRFNTAELLPRLEAQEVPYASINSRRQVIDDPQVRATGALLDFEHPIAGPMRQPRPPERLSETPADIFRCSPELGEHTREVPAEFGSGEEEITDLRLRKIVC